MFKKTIAFLGVALMGTAAQAAAILCEDPSLNHMYVDDSQVSSCLGAGEGNINGNVNTDDFYAEIGSTDIWLDAGDGSFTQDGDMGTWSIAVDFWDTNDSGAIGFKFGTGNQPDEWFVYELIDGVTSGDWEFVNVFGKGGGLSHIQVYSGLPQEVSEPGTLAILGLGILAVGLVRRRKSATL